MSKRFRHVIQALLVSAVVLVELVPAFSDAPLVIAVVLSREAAPYRRALEGFEQVLDESRRPAKLVEFTMEGAASDPAALAGRIRNRRPDLILTIGSSATQAIADQIHDIPIVFSLVLSTSGNGSMEGTRAAHRNLTGASMEIPLAFQFAKVKEVLPAIRRIGVMYNPAQTGSLVQEAGTTAAGMGLELVAIPVESEKQIVDTTEALGDKVDVLWSVADSTVFSPQGLKQILLATLRNRIPFVGLSPSFVKAGALLAFSVDYKDVGRQSGELALRVIGGEAPSEIPVSMPRSISLSVNMNTARQIQVTIQDDIRRKAELYF
ncbi:MAG: ABC transporter substrate-binding protein [Candidatus Polarisedimenticolia bacterium]